MVLRRPSSSCAFVGTPTHSCLGYVEADIQRHNDPQSNTCCVYHIHFLLGRMVDVMREGDRHVVLGKEMEDYFAAQFCLA